jgi:ABC-2 type transport system permease protein
MQFDEQVQSRSNFVLLASVYILDYVLILAFFSIIYQHVNQIQGWSFREALLLTSTAHLLLSLHDVLISTNVVELLNWIRKGTLDSLLTKPMPSLFICSFWKPDVTSIPALFYAITLWVISLILNPPTLGRLAFYFILFFGGFLIRWGIALLTASLAFQFVNVPAFIALCQSLFSYANYPRALYRGISKLIFTFIFPVGIIANVPAEALLSKGSTLWSAFLLVFSGLFFTFSVKMLQIRIRYYTSAGG